jgi:hypothetical protein
MEQQQLRNCPERRKVKLKRFPAGKNAVSRKPEGGSLSAPNSMTQRHQTSQSNY